MPSVILSEKQTRTYEGLVNLTDIYPTIADAAGVEVPNRDKLDGISFWPQMVGESDEEETILRYAFNKEFKRYAPTIHYPEGRFFDLRTDPLERMGDTVVEFRFHVLRYSGLDIHNLTPEQQKAYDDLGRILKQHDYVPVEELKIHAETTKLKVGEKAKVICQVLPENATRFGTIWESSDPEIASIDKFGEISTHKKGEVTIKVYSWDDAYPTSSNSDSTYFTAGIQHSVSLSVQ